MGECAAIVGMACRVSGANNTDELWHNILAQKDLRQRIPTERFNIDGFYHPVGTNKGTTNTKYGYFIDQPIGDFDAEFFGVSGKEAEAMDPQQRMMLEVTYEALENAGIAMQDIRGSRASVFCGMYTTSNDYLNLTGKDLEQYPRYMITGAGNSMLSNRISYFFDLHGPSMTVDTACSSSLVALHLGVQSLLNGEADMSIIVGSALHLAPNTFQVMADMGFLSADGRCRTFDADGSGYARGDGICAVVLKRQKDAIVSGDRIRAIIRGSGINHDGKTDGITLPSAEAQAALIRSTYEKAGISPDHTQYLEAHGTGTKAGDPLEARGAATVFATPTRKSPLLVGSIKSNIGHLEGAAGLAGVIKACLALENAVIPPNMHFKTPNPDIHFDEWKLKVPTVPLDWKTQDGIPRRASVNSFGYGGTNAHVIMEQYRPPSSPELMNGVCVLSDRPYLIPVTSHSEEAGRKALGQLEAYVTDHETVKPDDLAFTLSTRRSLHSYRTFVIGSSMKQIAAELRSPRPAAPWTMARQQVLSIGFVFTGQGAQTFDMGRELLEKSLLFRQTIRRCDDVLQNLPDGPKWRILNTLLLPEEASPLAQSTYSQPVCTALQIALVDLLRQWGIAPTAVCGHSSGEIAAAYAAGILSLEAAVVTAYYRGLFMGVGTSQGASGAMMAVGMSERATKKELQPSIGRLCVAAVNSQSSVTVSGDEDAISELCDTLTGRGVFARKLKVKQAFHSHHMLPLAPGYRKALEASPYFDKTEASSCRMFSSVTARLAAPKQMGAAYWAENMVRPVRFSDALIGTLLDENEQQNVDILLEVGPHPALKGPCREVMTSVKQNLPYFSTLQRNQAAFDSLLETAGQLFAIGYPVKLDVINQNQALVDGVVQNKSHAKRLRDLPTYAWNRKHYWADTRLLREHLHRPERHTLLGAPVPDAIPTMPRWRNYLRLSEITWLRDHNIDGKVVFPAAGYCCIALEAAARLRADQPAIAAMHLKQVTIKAPLTLQEDDEEGAEILLELHPVTTSAKTISDEWSEFSVCSFDRTGQQTEHCTGRVSIEYSLSRPLVSLTEYPTSESLTTQSDRHTSSTALYARLDSLHLSYGPRFALLRDNLASGPGFSVGSLEFDPSIFTEHELAERTILHPTLLDASFHAIFSAIETLLGRQITDAFVPTYMRSVDVSGKFVEQAGKADTQRYTVQTHTELPNQRTAVNRILLHDAQSGDLALEARGLELTALGTDRARDRTLFFRQRWQPSFDHLSSSQMQMSRYSLPELVRFYVFQHPSSRIFIDLSHPRELSNLIAIMAVPGTKRPLFSAVDVGKGCADIAELRSTFGPGVSECEPEGPYDLVILDERAMKSLKNPASSLLSAHGTLITDEANDSSEAVFSSAQPRAWVVHRSEIHSASLTDVTVIMPSATNSVSEEVLARLKSSRQIHNLDVYSLEDVSSTDIDDQHIIFLADLDHGVNLVKDWIYIRHLLTMEGKTIVWVTTDATIKSCNPDHAKTLGLLRTARSENSQSRFISLDMEATSSPDLITGRLLEVLYKDNQEEVFADRDGCLHIPRVEEDVSLNRKLPDGTGREPRLERLGDHASLGLRIGKVGLLETLHFVDEDYESKPLADEDVEVKVMASALNFHELAAAMGIIQDTRLGSECTGVVIRVGAKADGLKPGDRVIAYRPGQGSHITLVHQPASSCVLIPDSMLFAEAASLSAITTTAYHGLINLARLQPGETVLIHSAAGGVGQIALQIAQHIGAKVIATASTGKRARLKERYGLHDEQIFSSRDDSFVRGVMDVTKGKGVDVVLNSLAGRLLHATWSCMAPFGRFVEIGKRDIHQNSNLGMEEFRRCVSFTSLDLILMYEKDRNASEKLLRDSMQLVFDGVITAPDIVEYSYSQIEQAFRLMQLGKHTGKIILVPRDDDLVPVAPPTYSSTRLFDSEKTYLLTGGLGGLGTALAEWMYLRGARSFASMSRSGDNRPDAKATVQWLRSKRAVVTIIQGDVGVLEDVERAIAQIGPSLAGIFHTAVVLQDAMIRSITSDQLQTAMHAKCTGALNLHKATLGRALDFFVCWSSVSAICGNKGQGAYVAANAWMDAFMRWRREQGLVGTAMNVGALLSRGLAAQSMQIRQSLEKNKLDIISEQELMFLVEEAMAMGIEEPDDGGLDWHQIISGINVTDPDVWWAERSVFRALYANREYGLAPSVGGSSKNLSTQLASSTDEAGRVEVLLAVFMEKIAKVLGTPVESIIPSNPLSFYGLDSIVAVEFRKWFKETVDADLPLFDIMGAKSIEALVSKVITSMPVIHTKSGETVQRTASQHSEDASRGARNGLPGNSKRIPKAKLTVDYPMSTYQARMWFLDSQSEDKSRMNLTSVFELDGNPSEAAMKQSFEELVRRHGVLSSSFREQNGSTLTQQRHDKPGVNLVFRGLPANGPSLAAIVNYLNNEEFLIENGDLGSATLIKVTETHHALVLVFHHICFDRASLLRFIDGWMELYDAVVSGRGVDAVSSPKISYVDFAVWNSQQLASSFAQADLDFWKVALKEAPRDSTRLPFAKTARPAVLGSERNIVEASLQPALLTRMKRICSQASVTPFQFVLTAFASVLARYTGDDDIVILMVQGNRPHADVEDLIGCFTNVLPIRTTANSNEHTFEDLMVSISNIILDALSHDRIAYEDIVSAIGRPQRPGYMPIGNVCINYQSYGVPMAYKNGDFELTTKELRNIPSPCELSLEVVEGQNGGLTLMLEYATALYDTADMDSFLEALLAFMSSAVKDHRQPVEEIGIVSTDLSGNLSNGSK